MNTKTWKILFIIESAVIAIFFIWIFSGIGGGRNETELLREVSPDGGYVLIIRRIGNIDPFFHVENIEVVLRENEGLEHYSALFNVEISTGGPHAKYAVEWLEDGVQIILSGYKSQYYILPFKTLEDADRLL